MQKVFKRAIIIVVILTHPFYTPHIVVSYCFYPLFWNMEPSLPNSLQKWNWSVKVILSHCTKKYRSFCYKTYIDGIENLM